MKRDTSSIPFLFYLYSMINYVVIGTGNVSFHIVKHLVALHKSVTIYGRNKESVINFSNIFSIPYFDHLNQIKSESFVIICVPDKLVYEVVRALPDTCKVVYTAGSIELKQIANLSLGVLYPLQTFSKNREISLNEVPFLIETFSEAFKDELQKLANNFSSDVRWVDSDTRKKIHLTAVFCNNFTNHLLTLAQHFSDENKIDFAMFFPLIKETIEKAVELGAENAQTGPAKRNDLETIDRHINMLDDNMKTIYRTLTNSILESNGYQKL